MARNDKTKMVNDRYNYAKMKIAELSSDVVKKESLIDKDDDVKFSIGMEVKFGKGVSVSEKQKENRERFVESLILNGLSQREIIASITNSWMVNKEIALNYIKEAKEGLNDGWRENFSSEHDWHVAVRKKIVSKTIKNEKSDLRLTLAALDSLAKIQGIYDHKQPIEVKDTEFIEGEKALEEYQDIADDILEGNEEKLEEFRKQYEADRLKRMSDA